MNEKKSKRSRGIILTREGWQKFQNAKQEWELRDNKGYKITLEELSDRAGLTTATLRKIITRDCGVDKRSIATLFTVLNLELEPTDYTSPKPAQKFDSRRTLKKIDWGEATDVSNFYGRSSELAILDKWILEDNCRLITIVGMGGIGKTALSVKLAEQIKDKYDYIIWRSLRDAPPIQNILNNVVQFIGDEQTVKDKLPESTNEKISLLIKCLRSSRCLIILDNVETLLCDSSRAGVCEEEHKEYDLLFQRVAESEHQSCLLLTSREKPKQVSILEGKTSPVRSLQLTGFKVKEVEKILKTKGIICSESQLVRLVTNYGGNVLALKIVGTTIRDLFQGNVAEFLRQDTAIFGDIRDLLDQQFNRLIDVEKKIMYWLAINREPTTLAQIEEDLVNSVSKFSLLEGLQSLSRRCLIDKTESDEIEQANVSFTLQSVVMEYVTSNLIETVCQEIVDRKIKLFRFHALVKATAKDYIKNTQIRLILQSVINNLLNFLKGKRNLEDRLKQIIVTLQKTSPLEPGYTAGNIINLFSGLGTDFKGFDFSNLCIWQADLQNVCLHDVSFQNSDLTKTVFSETFSGIISVAFSSSGEILAAGDSNGDIHLWKVADSQPLNIFRGHKSWVTSLKFSPDDMLLASGSSDSNVKLWNVETGQCLRTLEEHQGEVWSVAFSPNGEMIASGSDDYTIRIWYVSTAECLKILQKHANWVLSVSFLNNKTLISGSEDKSIALWDINTCECQKILQGHSKGIRSIALSSDGQILATSSDDLTIKLWDISTGKCLKTLYGHTNQIFTIAFNPSKNILASGSHDQTIKLWNIDTGKCFKTFQGHSNWVFSVAFNVRGNTLASGSRDQTIKLWNIDTGKCFKTFQGYTNQVLSVDCSHNDKYLVSGGYDCTVKLWDVKTGQILKTLEGHDNWIYSVVFNSQSNLIASGSGDNTIKLWDVKTGQILKTLKGHKSIVYKVIFCSGDEIIASGSGDNTIKLWDVKTGQILKTLEGHSAAIWSMAASQDVNIIATGSLDSTIKLWNVSTGVCVKTLEGHSGWVWSITFSPNGNTLASSSPDNTLKLWDLYTGKCYKTLDLSTGWLLSCIFLKNNRMLAASCQDSTIKIFDLETCECIKNLLGHNSGYIWSITYQSNNQILVSCSEDETIKLWDLETSECVKTLKTKTLYHNLKLKEATGINESNMLRLKSLGAVTGHVIN